MTKDVKDLKRGVKKVYRAAMNPRADRSEIRAMLYQLLLLSDRMQERRRAAGQHMHHPPFEADFV